MINHLKLSSISNQPGKDHLQLDVIVDWWIALEIARKIYEAQDAELAAAKLQSEGPDANGGL